MQNTPDSMELVLEHSPMRTPRTPSAAGSSCVSELWSSPDSNILASSSSGRDPGKANADASASQHSQALIGGPSLQAQEPKRRRSTAACKMLCRAHWRCIGCFQTRAFCRGLTFLLLGVLVLHSAKQAPVQPSKNRAYKASARLNVTGTRLYSSKSNCLVGVDHHRHALPVSLQRNSLQMMAQSASDYPQVASVQTLITEAASYGPAGHPYSSETQMLETRCVNLSQGTILMKTASVCDVPPCSRVELTCLLVSTIKAWQFVARLGASPHLSGPQQSATTRTHIRILCQVCTLAGLRASPRLPDPQQPALATFRVLSHQAGSDGLRAQPRLCGPCWHHVQRTSMTPFFVCRGLG